MYLSTSNRPTLGRRLRSNQLSIYHSIAVFYLHFLNYLLQYPHFLNFMFSFHFLAAISWFLTLKQCAERKHGRDMAEQNGNFTKT